MSATNRGRTSIVLQPRFAVMPSCQLITPPPACTPDTCPERKEASAILSCCPSSIKPSSQFALILEHLVVYRDDHGDDEGSLSCLHHVLYRRSLPRCFVVLAERCIFTALPNAGVSACRPFCVAVLTVGPAICFLFYRRILVLAFQIESFVVFFGRSVRFLF